MRKLGKNIDCRGAGSTMVVAAYRRSKVRELLQDRLICNCRLAYAVLHFVVGILWNGVEQAQAGLLIDLRYVLYFVVLYMLLRLEPGMSNGY